MDSGASNGLVPQCLLDHLKVCPVGKHGKAQGVLEAVRVALSPCLASRFPALSVPLLSDRLIPESIAFWFLIVALLSSRLHRLSLEVSLMTLQALATSRAARSTR
jgi:hypothetical protein